MLTLGIETSCDETSVAVVDSGRVLSNVVSSSVHLHADYGGVIPEIASRFHVEYIHSVFKRAMETARCGMEEIGLVGVTERPGLPGSLLVGAAFAKAVGYAADKPVMGVDHVEAHALSAFLDRGYDDMESYLPLIGLVVSGGHTNIYVIRDIHGFELVGRTRDDAAGEAFDKVAKVLGLAYPGGPEVEKRALSFDGDDPIELPRALMGEEGDLDFSFSGVKTAVMYRWKDSLQDEREICRICSSFQQSAADVILEKVRRASERYGIKRIAAGGGVINNRKIRERLSDLAHKGGIEIYLPETRFCGDNGAMIAALAENRYLGK